MAQGVGVVGVFIATGDLIDALAQQFQEGVADFAGLTAVLQAAGGAGGEAELAVEGGEQEQAAVGGEGAAGKVEDEGLAPSGSSGLVGERGEADSVSELHRNSLGLGDDSTGSFSSSKNGLFSL